MDLTDDQFVRYARHLILDEVGDAGQARLLNARVLVVGAGGLGAPLLLYLAAAGVGTLGIVDDDVVDLSNLQRQVIHMTAAVDLPKTDSAAATIAAVNPDVRVERHSLRLTEENVAALIADYDLVADGSDNFATRYTLNDACFRAGKPLVAAALLRFEGQISTFRGGAPGHHGEPCYRCLFPKAPPPGAVPRCDEAGILGAVAGVLGTLQATEVIKELLDLGDSLSGRLLIYDSLAASFRNVRFKRDPDCALCGDGPADIADRS
ncbi:MAG: molybdopterin-synthase adenylyltransferase MoeB [Pseudomonadota bacterium]|nr:molybdopterin-synthase adenylyltransferase MoeB [Pseudomonadota bacterium]MEC9217642.1 molybdopterin-synthase adenylyltransferase MoeB [Pseudomonadota bacterium]